MRNLLEWYGVPGIAWDFIALLIAFLFVIGSISVIGVLNKRGVVPDDFLLITQHIFAAPVGIIAWTLYSNEPQSRFIASLVPAVFVVLFAGILSGKISNREIARLVWKGEDINVLRAPLIYSITIVLLTIVCWPVPFSELGTADYSSFVPTAILVTGPYTGGWGMGHLMTRSYARLRFRVLEQRSVEGTVAIVVFGMLFSYALLAVFSWTIYAASPSALSLTSIELLVAVAIASMVAAAVEVLSPAIYDNFLIPLSVFIVILILGHLGVFGFSVLSL